MYCRNTTDIVGIDKNLDKGFYKCLFPVNMQLNFDMFILSFSIKLDIDRTEYYMTAF